MNTITFRHEQKIEISPGDLLALRMRLRAILKPDSHTPDGRYEIRSLYFDNNRDKALHEKLDGVNYREKFRLRCYNANFDFIRLEKKSKINGLCHKESTVLSLEQTKAILSNTWLYTAFKQQDASDTENTFEKDFAIPHPPLLQEFTVKAHSLGLKPKTLVEYTREAYVFAPGNVRITLDYNIRTGILSTDFLNPDCVLVPAGEAPAILEVKWDEYLPELIRNLVQMPHCRIGSFSKYTACRIYG